MNKSPHPITTLQEKMREEYDKQFGMPGFEHQMDRIKDFISQAISTAYEQGRKDGKKKVGNYPLTTGNNLI